MSTSGLALLTPFIGAMQGYESLIVLGAISFLVHA